MEYRTFDIDTGNRLIDLCEQQKIEYDIWNAEDLIGGGERMEIGVENWSKLPACYSEVSVNGET